MARKISNPRLSTRTARERLPRRSAPYWVSLSQGLHLGYSKKGRVGTWLVKWRDAQTGKRYQAKLAPADDTLDEGADVLDFDAAQERARAWVLTLSTGDRGRTVGDVLDTYLEYLHTAGKRSTYLDATARVEKLIRPSLGGIALSKLTTEQIRGWQASLTGKKDTANRILTILKAALNRAYGDGLIGSDTAWRRVKPYPAAGTARKVFLTDAQCQHLLNNAPDNTARNLFQAGLYTGCRFGELADAKVVDFDPLLGTLMVDGKTGRREVFLSTVATDWFTSLVGNRSGDARLLLRADGTPWHRVAVGRAIRAVPDLPVGTCFYTLRHTYISFALLRGVNHQVLAENCGTSIRMLEKHYGKFMRADRKAMFEVMT